MAERVHVLFLPLVFPFGVSPGSGSDYNVLRLARSGLGQIVLRGSSLSGVLRHTWRKFLLDEYQLSEAELELAVEKFFGSALRQHGDAWPSESEFQEAITESRVKVDDCVLNTSDDSNRMNDGTVKVRTYNARDRHTGVVIDSALFSMETCPPGTTTLASLWLRDDFSDTEESDALARITPEIFLQTMAECASRGIQLGGHSSRGIGVARLVNGEVVRKAYDLSQVSGYGQYLTDVRAWQKSRALPLDGSRCAASVNDQTHVLEIDLCLIIPRGQDLLVGYGQGVDHQIEPQRITRSDGVECWLLPGSTLRGVFRGWSTRLAARENLHVADSVGAYQLRVKQGNRASLNPSEFDEGQCVVSQLFGSPNSAGRIHFSDALSPCGEKVHDAYPEEQVRMHVAVDRITGGAVESMLFDNTVLVGTRDRSPEFHIRIRIAEPKSYEVAWIAKCIRALDIGVIRVGSSKSSGRLSLKCAPKARGAEEYVKMVESIQPFDVC